MKFDKLDGLFLLIVVIIAFTATILLREHISYTYIVIIILLIGFLLGLARKYLFPKE